MGGDAGGARYLRENCCRESLQGRWRMGGRKMEKGARRSWESQLYARMQATVVLELQEPAPPSIAAAGLGTTLRGCAGWKERSERAIEGSVAWNVDGVNYPEANYLESDIRSRFLQTPEFEERTVITKIGEVTDRLEASGDSRRWRSPRGIRPVREERL